MYWSSLLSFAALAQAAPQFGGFPGAGLTMLRFGCPNVVIDRLDPLVNPGLIPSPHVHQIVGGNGFNASMTTGDVSETATCTTCQFSEDFSNYWTANLYFKARNGTYKRVPQTGHACVTRHNSGVRLQLLIIPLSQAPIWRPVQHPNAGRYPRILRLSPARPDYRFPAG